MAASLPAQQARLLWNSWVVTESCKTDTELVAQSLHPNTDFGELLMS